MRRSSDLAIQILALLMINVVPWLASAQNAPPSLAEQLQAQYNFVKTGSDSNGLTILEPGTVLVIQKAGILGVQPTSVAMCPAKYQDGTLKGPNGFCLAMVQSVSRYFTVGEKVYPTKLEVNLPKEKISLQLLDCDSCNGANPPAYYKSEIVFQFAKGYLETAGVSKVEDTIAQVLSIDDSANQPQQAQDPQADQAQPNSQPEPEPPPAQTQTIELGQTIVQVTAALGKPEKIVNLRSKQIYVYKDLKITFVNGKVSDVK
jgi:hypothetical protein